MMPQRLFILPLLALVVVFGVLFGSVGVGLALPKCKGSPSDNRSIWLAWSDCEGTATFPNGNIYVGMFGKGFANGRILEGVFEQGGGLIRAKKTTPSSLTPCYNASYWTNCRGVKTFPNGTKYIGMWKGGFASGHGIIIKANGDISTHTLVTIHAYFGAHS